jgi:hypothetical protein
MGRRRHTGTVRSDAQAFRHIARRFQDEVGGIIRNIDFENGPVPFWALIRIMFPVVESIGDLIYREDRATARNLRSVLEREFANIRSAYRGKAALLALLYRHSLTHDDELRTITSKRQKIGWMITSDQSGEHLTVVKPRPRLRVIVFQPLALYQDVLDVCESAATARWRGEVKRRLQRLDVARSGYYRVQRYGHGCES